jgi:KUP system potassium uptake protein
MVMQIKLAIKKIAFDPARWFGLEYSDVILEHVPLVIGEQKEVTKLNQIQVDDFDEEDD